jgi:glycosyltransferase involved in cell wall biosynthesis
MFLVEELRANHEKPIHLFPPGIDLEVFPQNPLFKPRVNRPRVVVGCIGSLGQQIDWQTLHALARSEQQLDFRFVGTVPEVTRQAPGFQEFVRLPNVFFQGMVPHETVPSIIDGFDLCTIPYKVNAYTAGVNPLKLVEYLALGKPIVSSPIPAVDCRNLVYTASGVEAWRTALRQALAEDKEERFRARVEFAHGQSYENRISQLLTLIGSHDRDAIGSELMPKRSRWKP